jgi:hypothetical protein
MPREQTKASSRQTRWWNAGPGVIIGAESGIVRSLRVQSLASDVATAEMALHNQEDF